MQKVTLLAVGSIREQWAKEAVKMYKDRLNASLDFTLTELPPSRQPHATGQMIEESERLLKSLEKMKGELWVLDERGTQMTSPLFAKEIDALKDRGEPVTFIIGGAYGLSDKVRSSARKVIALSSMVLPHELCRVVFLEQLYRAMEINKGSGYHH